MKLNKKGFELETLIIFVLILMLGLVVAASLIKSNFSELVPDKKDNKYELIVLEDTCMNCYKEIYKFKDKTVYSSCDVKYKTSNIEISVKEAIDKNFLTLSDLEESKMFLIKMNDEVDCSVCS